ncbi:hypothetical protein [Catenuloplanes atrovinosus]|uniref:Uncharacterized protein n=1 Tax=Catenuloplanes atrovinosus TaxID=137266 RepID=A0AAE3YV47_9ACTN|nr:hypothetical protein [Catenuloplanes atrovinosus]MDR7280459.1 hypothetical protein [Catenuloplanes atrovinosus]
MGSISSISGGANTAYANSGRVERRDPMATVAKTLGLDNNTLREKMREGTSLADIAETQGVAHDDLIAAIKEGLPVDKANSPQAAELAESLANATNAGALAAAGGAGGPGAGGAGAGGSGGGHGSGPGGGLGGPGLSGPPRATTESESLTRISNLLEMSTDEVSSQVHSATDLLNLASSKGVTTEQLTSVLQRSGSLVDVRV